MNDANSTPYIGLIVDFYPSPSERRAAIVVEVHPPETESRPHVNLVVYEPDGETVNIRNIAPVDEEVIDENEPDQIALTNRWAFAHEFAILQDPDTEEGRELGTQSNAHVGMVSTDII